MASGEAPSLYQRGIFGFGGTRRETFETLGCSHVNGVSVVAGIVTTSLEVMIGKKYSTPFRPFAICATSLQFIKPQPNMI